MRAVQSFQPTQRKNDGELLMQVVEYFRGGYDWNRKSGEILPVSCYKIIGAGLEGTHGLNRIFKILPTET